MQRNHDVNDKGMQWKGGIRGDDKTPAMFTTDCNGRVIDTVNIKAPTPHITSYTPLVEYGGNIMRQFCAELADMEYMEGKSEGRTDIKYNLLPPDKIILRDVSKYIIRPFKIGEKVPFVHTLPSAATPPPTSPINKVL